jgi:hypothetical protein
MIPTPMIPTRRSDTKNSLVIKRLFIDGQSTEKPF